VAAWIELTNFKMYHFGALAPPQILAQLARIDVLFPFCCIVARLLGCRRKIKPVEHHINIFGTGSLNDITPNFYISNLSTMYNPWRSVQLFTIYCISADGRTDWPY